MTRLDAFVEVNTERLRLRRFRESDVADALEYRNDAAFVRFLPHIPYPFTLAHARDFVSLNMSEDWRTSPTFAVVLGDKLIGTVNFEIDAAREVAMLGYAIGRRWWGRGLAMEATTAAIRWVRDAHRLQGLWASTDVRNVKSQRLLDGLGFTRDEVCRAQHRDRDGEELDEVVYRLHFGP